MAYSYRNKAGKLVSGAAANSHRVYTIHHGPVQQYKHIVGYTLAGVMMAHGIRKGIEIIGEVIIEKRKNKTTEEPPC